MATKTSIFNGALLILGIAPDIQDANTDPGAEVDALRGAYEAARQHVIRQHDWSCLTMLKTLTVVGTAPDGWLYQYKYPTGVVKVIEIARATNQERAVAFKTGLYEDEDNGKIRVIWTHAAGAKAMCLSDETDPSLFDPMLADAISAFLAYRVSRVLTTDKDGPTRAWNAFQLALAQAMRVDANEAAPDTPAEAEWITARGA